MGNPPHYTGELRSGAYSRSMMFPQVPRLPSNAFDRDQWAGSKEANRDVVT